MSQIDHLSLQKPLEVLLLGHVEGWRSAGRNEKRSQREVRLLAEQVTIYPSILLLLLYFSHYSYSYSYNYTYYFLFVSITEYLLFASTWITSYQTSLTLNQTCASLAPWTQSLFLQFVSGTMSTWTVLLQTLCISSQACQACHTCHSR